MPDAWAAGDGGSAVCDRYVICQGGRACFARGDGSGLSQLARPEGIAYSLDEGRIARRLREDAGDRPEGRHGRRGLSGCAARALSAALVRDRARARPGRLRDHVPGPRHEPRPARRDQGVPADRGGTPALRRFGATAHRDAQRALRLGLGTVPGGGAHAGPFRSSQHRSRAVGVRGQQHGLHGDALRGRRGPGDPARPARHLAGRAARQPDVARAWKACS